MYRNRTEQETMRQDSNAFLRRQCVLREAQPDGYPRQGELCSAESIEAIILDSVAQRDREYIVRQIGRINEANEKAVSRRSDSVLCLLVGCLFRGGTVDG
jgi:hypothetical protein